MDKQTKRYSAPTLATRGGLVEVTRMTGVSGTGDPDNPVLWKKVTAGAAGFML